ncbi:hypothetical protein CAOG_009616 [Capsaspora owczarzaki ATCC 30864]|uniref:Uncharacterized protein n=1 Tax=Capsaspora owczarzaki (strain ATCC 30864) TaxID=595528 RepID=A0A0D2X254_CAPO3|nr:hypothetical protein CAOG_009616 [Capsaspora owczarzaki ATCC 30864]
MSIGTPGGIWSPASQPLLTPASTTASQTVAAISHHQQYAANAGELTELCAQLERNVEACLAQVDAALRSPYSHSRAIDDLDAMTALLARMEEQAISSQLQHLPAPSSQAQPTAEPGTSSMDPQLLDMDVLLVETSNVAAALHRDHQRLTKNFELATKRLESRP